MYALLKVVKETGGQPLDPRQILLQSSCMIMGYLCYGKFYDANSEEIATILSTGSEFGKAIAFGVLCDYIPEAGFLLKRKLKALKEYMENILKYSDKLSSDHIDNYDREDLRDISDMYRKAGEEMSETEKEELKFDNRMLKDTLASLFGAGFGTVTSTLRYGVMLMAHHPDVQVKVQEEIDRVIGKENFPDSDDINGMPYTMAVINEIYRYHSMSPFALTHSTTCDTELDGYFIAKGTPVMINLWSAHRDPTVFTDPDNFRPDRFLTPDGKLDAKAVEYVIPYGLGLRRCAGEIIARMEINIFFLTLLQRCKIIESPEHPLDPEDYVVKLGVSINPYKVTFEPRYSGAFDLDI